MRELVADILLALVDSCKGEPRRAGALLRGARTLHWTERMMTMPRMFTSYPPEESDAVLQPMSAPIGLGRKAIVRFKLTDSPDLWEKYIDAEVITDPEDGRRYLRLHGGGLSGTGLIMIRPGVSNVIYVEVEH